VDLNSSHGVTRRRFGDEELPLVLLSGGSGRGNFSGLARPIGV
jgi:hypothetical protein